jgi:hypothetical protein
MIKVIFFLFIFLVMAFSGCMGNDPDEKSPVEFILRFENIKNRVVENSTLWDVIISVDSYNSDDYFPLWMNIKVWIEKEDGSESHHYKYKPEKYDYIPTNYPLVFYEDLTGHPDQVDEMDAFSLTGLDESFENAILHVYYGGKDAGSIRLPEDFVE